MTRLPFLGVIAAALVIGIVALGGSTPGTDAAACNEGASVKGRISPGESVSVEATFCSDPTDSLVGWVNWGKKVRLDKDLAVIVTSPSGMEFVFDDGPSSTQTFIVFGPLEEGDWTVEVVNVGSRSATYDLQMAFG